MQASPSDQRGSALVFVLCVIMFVGVITVALTAFAGTNNRATGAYKEVRADRYAADAAIKEAVNWIASNPDVAVDPLYQPTSNDDCVTHSTRTDGEVLTVSCKTEPGSGAGVPPDAGINPPEALLLLGDRHHEPGPYSYAKCTSLWNDVVSFFTGDTPGVSETSFFARKRQRTTWGGIGTCTNRERGTGPVRIEGEVTSAGRLSLNDGFTLEVAGGDGGVVKSRYGCTDSNGGSFDQGIQAPGGANISTQAQCNRADTTRSDPGMPWDGTSIYSDPGRVAGSITPIGDVRPEFLPVGFDQDGSVKAGYTLPSRTTAYVYDKTANTSGTAEVPKYLKPLTAASSGGVCQIPAGTPVVFLWGRYSSAETLNKYTADSACSDRTFWFAPDPGADRELLTTDDRTAAFYLDFTDTASARACGGMEGTNASRWCLGGSSQNATSKPRVVVGWPNDWTAMPTSTATGSGNDIGYGNRVGAYMDTAGAVEGNFLSFWSNTDKARTVDTAAATYEPCVLNLFWWVVPCPSFGQRSLRLAQFTPKVAGGPIAETGLPNGRLWVDVTFAMRNATGTVPKIDVDYLDPSDGVAKSCSGPNGYTLQIGSVLTNHAPGTSVPATSLATITAADAADLANDCGAVDAINNLRVTFRVDGNTWNSGSGVPTFDLDGVRIRYDSYQGAAFPLPVDANGGVVPIGTTQPAQPAKSDCDESKPGGQLIFGGSSHVYAADGSLEVCGGPNPEDPSGSLVIGVFGVPAVDSVRPASIAVDTASAGSTGTSLASADSARRIGEPNGNETASATISYPGECVGFIGIGPCDPIDGGAKDIKATFPQVNVPSGYQVKQIAARVSYEAEGPFLGFTASSDGAKLKAGACTEDARTTNHELRQWANETSSSSPKLVLYSRGTSRNCISPTTLSSASGSELRWKTNVPGGWGVVFGGRCFVIIGSCDYTQEDRLDGMELDVTIEPTGTLSSASDTTTPILRPQSGCIVAHPNYDGGEGDPDCALIRGDSYTANGTDSVDSGLCLGNCAARRTNWFGRVSVKGTIYAPSAAVEIDDNDVGYPLATRGLIARQLRISGARPRSGYTAPMIGSELDKVPAARSATLTACLQSATRIAAGVPCDPNVDQVRARSGVLFEVDPTVANAQVATVPRVEWYTDERTAQ